jgi:hypothetical protein
MTRSSRGSRRRKPPSSVHTRIYATHTMNLHTRLQGYCSTVVHLPPHAGLGAPWARCVNGHSMRSRAGHSPSEKGLDLARPNPNLAPGTRYAGSQRYRHRGYRYPYRQTLCGAYPVVPMGDRQSPHVFPLEQGHVAVLAAAIGKVMLFLQLPLAETGVSAT